MEKFIIETRSVPVDFDPFAGPEIESTVPSTEAQREVFVASEMGSSANSAYNESVTLVLEGKLDRAALMHAMRTLIARHESLRSVMSANGTHMVVFRSIEFNLAYHDLSSFSKEDRDRKLEEIGTKDMDSTFDLINGPLFRSALIKISEEEHHLRLTGHHVVCDGWSLGIIMAEVSELYNAHLSKRSAALPPAFQYSEYALATIDFAKSSEHEKVEHYWIDQFKGHIPRVDLPTDRPRPKQKTYRGQRFDVELDPALVRG